VFDCDPRKNTGAGLSRDQSGGTSAKSESTEDESSQDD